MIVVEVRPCGRARVCRGDPESEGRPGNVETPNPDAGPETRVPRTALRRIVVPFQEPTGSVRWKRRSKVGGVASQSSA
jgi:hypothetical protein